VTSRTKNYFLTTLYFNAKGSHQGAIMKLTGEKALITGGNSGIGLATARLFVAEGAEVAITGRDQKTLDEAVAELGANARGYRADVTVADDRKRLFVDLARDFGKLDIVFVNAGISGRTPTGSTDETIFENVIRTNLNAAFFTVNFTHCRAPPLSHKEVILCPGFSSPTARKTRLPSPAEFLIGSRFTSARTTFSWTSTETTKSYKETDREEGNYPRRTV
jgi:hypothetical protein